VKVTSIHEAKTHLSKLVQRAVDGEEIIIGKAGKAMVKLIPYDVCEEHRQPGQWRGKVKMAKDFDQLPEDIVGSFSGQGQ